MNIHSRSVLGEPDQAEIADALARLLASDRIARSSARSKLLSYVVEQALAGRGARIKAYTIAVEALGRPPDWDPQADPIVRVEAMRLRASLQEYYEYEGAGDPVLILLPKGRYVPSFQWRNPPAHSQDSQPQPPVPERKKLGCLGIALTFTAPGDIGDAQAASQQALRHALSEAVPRFSFMHLVPPAPDGDEAPAVAADFAVRFSLAPGPDGQLAYCYQVWDNADAMIIWQGQGAIASPDAVLEAARIICGAVFGHSGCIHRHNLSRLLSGRAFSARYECLLGYVDVIQITGDPAREAEMRTKLERQLQNDRGFGACYAYLAHLICRHSWTHPAGWTKHQLMLRAWHLALRATELSPASGFVQSTLHWISEMRGEFQLAAAAYTAATTLNPYDPEILMVRGGRLICSGDPAQGNALIEPWLLPEISYPIHFLFYLAVGKFLVGDLDGLETYGQRIPADPPSGSQSHPGALLLRTLIAHGRGRHALARHVAAAMRQSLLATHSSIEDFLARYLLDLPSRQALADAFLAAESDRTP